MELQQNRLNINVHCLALCSCTTAEQCVLFVVYACLVLFSPPHDRYQTSMRSQLHSLFWCLGRGWECICTNPPAGLSVVLYDDDYVDDDDDDVQGSGALVVACDTTKKWCIVFFLWLYLH